MGEINYMMADTYPYQVLWKGPFGSGTLYYRTLGELYLKAKAGEFKGVDHMAIHIKADRSISIVAV